MKYICFSAILVLFTLQAYTQELNKKVLDEKTGTEILIGYCDEPAFQLGEFGESYSKEFKAFQPKDNTMNQLKGKLDDITFTIVLGTWCDDTKEQLGRFTKLLYCLKYDMNRCTFIAVDRTKTAEKVPMDDLKIEKVPTFIVYRNAVEIGRIVETPEASMDTDLMKIIQK